MEDTAAYNPLLLLIILMRLREPLHTRWNIYSHNLPTPRSNTRHFSSPQTKPHEQVSTAYLAFQSQHCYH